MCTCTGQGKRPEKTAEKVLVVVQRRWHQTPHNPPHPPHPPKKRKIEYNKESRNNETRETEGRLTTTTTVNYNLQLTTGKETAAAAAENKQNNSSTSTRGERHRLAREALFSNTQGQTKGQEGEQAAYCIISLLSIGPDCTRLGMANFSDPFVGNNTL